MFSTRAFSLVAALAMLAAPAILGMPAATAEPNAAPEGAVCPYREATPPAVDSSEVPEAGDPPAPLPVPAKPLGGEPIAHEQALDQLFAKGEITPDRLTAETAAIGEVQGRLRSMHLAAHLATRALLNPDQIARYE